MIVRTTPVRAAITVTAFLVLCALALVTSQDRARHLFVELERAQQQARQLDIEWNQLVLEQSELSKASLIDSKARAGLAMRPVDPAKTLHLNMAGDPPKHAMGVR